MFVAIDMLNYLRPFKDFGAIILMIEQILRDMRPFLVVVIIFLVAFVLAYAAAVTIKPINAFYIFVQLAFGGGYEPEDFERAEAKCLLVFYLLFNVIILLNLLIAIMGDSYDKVRENESVSKLSNRAVILNAIDNSYGWLLAWFYPDVATYYYPKYLHVLTNRALQNTQNIDSDRWEGGVKELKHAIKAEGKLSQEVLSSGFSLIKRAITESSRARDESFHVYKFAYARSVSPPSSFTLQGESRLNQLDQKIVDLLKMVEELKGNVPSKLLPSSGDDDRRSFTFAK